MNKFFFLPVLLFHAGICKGQDTWISKTLFEQFEVSFPAEPGKFDLGSTYNYLLRKDSVIFQSSQMVDVEGNRKSTWTSCHEVIISLLAGSGRTLLEQDSVKMGKFCAIHFKLLPGKSALENYDTKGFVLDMNGDVFLVMANHVRGREAIADRFLQSFRFL